MEHGHMVGGHYNMKAIINKVNYFTPIDDKGVVQGTYYLDQCGNVVMLDGKPTPVLLPYVVSVNVGHMDDVCTMHISEIEDMIVKLKANNENVKDHDLKMKYVGYIEALNYVVTHNSYIDPWGDFIDSIEEEFNYEEQINSREDTDLL